MVSLGEVPTPSDLEVQALVDNHQGSAEAAVASEEMLSQRSSSTSGGGDVEEDDDDDGDDDGDAQIRPRRSSSVGEAPRGSLTYLNGLALVISLQIGSGIFFTPSEVSKHVPSAGAGVLVWLLAGIMVWTGAASFVELGRAIPRNGGIQEYLRHCYGEFYGFIFSWIWVSICKPCSMAVIATIFAKHLNSALLPDSMDSIWAEKFVAIVGLALLTILNCLGTNTGAHAANVFLVLKLSALFSIVVIGMSIGVRGQGDGVGRGDESGWFSSDRPHTSLITAVAERNEQTIWLVFGDYVTALFAALYCYGGWESAGFVAGDLKHPARDLPRILNSAMVVVIIGFCLMNIALYIVLPLDTIRDTGTPVVTFGFHVFGIAGRLLYSLVVAISCLGALNANIFATGRLCVAASRRNYFPKSLGDSCCSSREEEQDYYKQTLRRYPSIIVSVFLWIARVTQHVRWEKNVPVYAMLLNNTIASIYVVIGSYRSLLTFIGISQYTFFFFAVLGVFVLRRRALPNEPGPRPWIINPVAFCFFSGFIILRGIVTDPFQGIAICIIALIGWIFWRFQRRNEVGSREDFLLGTD